VQRNQNTLEVKNISEEKHAIAAAFDRGPTTVNVLGSCASRNIFNVDSGRKYKVEGYVFGINPFLIFNESPPEYHIDDTDLASHGGEFINHPFNVRILKRLFNGGAWEGLTERKGDWIILDTHYAYAYLIILYYPDGRELLFQGLVGFIESVAAASKNLKNCFTERIDGFLNFSYYADKLADFLRTNWGDRIIVIDSVESGYYVEDDGSIFPIEYSDYSGSHSGRMAELLVQRLECSLIRMPFVPITEDENSVHYISEIRTYLKEKVDAIIDGKDKSVHDGIDNGYRRKIEDIQAGVSSAVISSVRKILRIFSESSEKEYQWALDEAKALFRSGAAEGFWLMSRAYRDGKGVEKDLFAAADWIKRAIEKDAGWKNELFDILWKMDTPESRTEMIAVATESAAAGNREAMGRLGRAYRDGKGVEKDLNTAAEWMRKAAYKNVKWAKNELFDVLWMIDTPESRAEMVAVATAFADTGDGGAMGRLGRAYREGKGVEKDLITAAYWMRWAAGKNVRWAGNELFDILWMIDTPNSREEMVAVAAASANAGNKGAMERLGRAYGEGKGVEKDSDKAAEWMKRAK
jgi:TPR repeat protein